MLTNRSVSPAALRFSVILAAVLVLLCAGVMAQTTISTGSIQGTVTDESGAVVSGAKVTIANKATGQSTTISTNAAGLYASGALRPADYEVRVEAKGFKTVVQTVAVQVNTTSTVSAKLAIGESTQVVEVQASDVAVNTEQATVQGVLTSEQIETMPINGRNFLDLAQLEPGVQIQDGGTFDPTKNGFSSISFGGRFGRTARIELDGVDISDETVGTTTQNVPLGAIQEASLQQSSLDLSTELTSSGSVSLATKSGTNGLHGDAFYYFRNQVLNAALPNASTNYFERNQYGGSLGGPIVKNKLFFYADAERNKQDFVNPVVPGSPFEGLAGTFVSPFREPELLGKLDYSAQNFKLFYRVAYTDNKSVLPFIPNSFQPFANVDHARSHVVGIDFNTGSFTHSIRFGYTKFENGITDAVTGSSIFNPAPGVELAIGQDPFCLTAGFDQFCSGVNFLAPQKTMQSDHQVKYDGSKVLGNHVLRYGGGINHIQGGGLAAFLGLAPAVGAPNSTPTCVAANNCPFPNGAANPLNYPASDVILGNGVGFSSARTSFGLPGGGLGPDDRLSAYIGDAWKLRSNLTLTLGVRYVRDTGRTDSDLGPFPVLNQFNNQFYSNLGARVSQPNHNFAPQIGLAWDPAGNGKTVLRGGIGLFYENSIWNNVLFDPAARLQQGLFLGFAGLCSGGSAPSGGVSFPDGTVVSQATLNATVCGLPIGTAAPAVAALQQQYQKATIAAGPAANGSYMGTTLTSGIDINTTSVLAPNYVTPRSVQMNFGIQREIRSGMVVTVDYLRNVATHNLQSVDTNHVGDARFFNAANALAAVTATNASFGCPSGPAGINCAIAAGATISDYASNGLDSGYQICGGFPCPSGGPGAAFPGINSNLGANQLLFPIGRSVYNGLQASLRQNVHNPFPGLKNANFQVSYSFSRYVSTTRDSDFINFSQDNNNPLKYIGPNGLDRKHQVSFGGTFDLPAHLQTTFIGHFYSPLPLNLNLPTTGAPGGIFVTDVTGDGTGDGSFPSNGSLGDLLPGTNVGAFGREVSTGKLATLINNYNNNTVGQPTPAGQVLISNNLFTLAQLQQLGGVQGYFQGPGAPTGLNPVVAGAVGQAWLRSFDFGLSWGYKFKDRFELRPGVTAFNIFNFANFDGVSAPFSSTLDAMGQRTPGSPNGTTNPQPNSLRLGLGSGVFALGAPRVIEFELKFKF